MDYQNGSQRRKLPKAVIAICVVLAVLFAIGLSRELAGRHEINKEIKRLTQEKAALEQKNKELADMAASFEGDNFIEKEARLKLGLQKPGEKVVVIKRDGVSPVSGPAGSVEPSGGLLASAERGPSNPAKW